jgi:Sjoegren syndrome nuclear autoantigen 1
MSAAAGGASLQNYNTELVKCLEDLREKRELLNKTIVSEERKKADIQRKLEKLNSQLQRVNESLAAKAAARNEYDITISETEAAYLKILESSQTLLHVLKRESVSLIKKKQAAIGGVASPSSEMRQQQQQQHQHQQQQQQEQYHGGSQHAHYASSASGGYGSARK